VLLKQVRDETSLDVKRADFKLDMLSPHLFMNFRVVDEHGRQLGHGRNLGALKAEWGAKARGAFQALAGLKLSGTAAEGVKSDSNVPPAPDSKAQAAIKSGVKGSAQSAQPTKPTSVTPSAPAGQRYTTWTFGELPELMEIKKAGQTLIGFPALIDGGDAVTIEVFDEPEVAAAKHRAGLRRLFALQIKDTKNAPEATADAQQQLQRLVPKNFIAAAPWTQLAHYARYLKAITLRLDKYRADPARDAAKLAELRPQEQRYWRLVAERKGQVDARMQELRWLLEELRVSFFAQELRTPQPVSVKRLDKLWAQIQS
jgi:hypothetical protein